MTKNVIICGAAGRDFHNFNVIYRGNADVRVCAFTATQIPDIDGRVYPAELAGERYPDGIPIHAEADLAKLVREYEADEVVFAYSDVTHDHVMQVGATAMAAGASFTMLSPTKTMVECAKPVVSVCAVRTGCGKSQTTRAVSDALTALGKKVVAIRHPMPYGDLVAQKVQRFAATEDLQKHKCTIEEMEEYEPHIDRGRVIYAGVDYEAIVRQAEQEADVVLWDGGNNDTPFYRADLEIVVVDPHRPNHELHYHPGMTNFLRAHVIVINKVDSADPKDVATLETNIARYNAGVVAAKRHGAGSLVDPRPWTVGTISQTFAKYPAIGTLLPAMGYGDQQVKDLETTINKVECDVVLSATPIDLARIVKVDKPMVRVRYELEEISQPTLADVLKKHFA